MTLALVVLLLLAVAGLVATNKRLPWGRPVLIVATVLALGLASWDLVARSLKKSPARQAMDVQTEAGRVLAEQTLTLVDSGRFLVLTYAPAASGERLFTDLRLAGFTNALVGKNIELILAGPNMAQTPTSASSFLVWPQESLARSVSDWLAQNKDVKAVVSLMPFPPRDLSTRDVPFFAFAVHEMPEWQAGVKAGRTKAVLVSRPTVMKVDPAQGKPTWNDMFELVTPQNIANYKTSPGY